MTNLDDLFVYTRQDGDTWLVATNVAPYFCFEAESKDAAAAKAARAIRLVKRALRETTSERREEVAKSWHQIPARELAAVA